jgi:LmbE family N-acetylglucosaminyl deacetylase
VSRHTHPVPVLMVVHAHPDDESSQTGGTLARYAAAGYRTVLITCTDGGQGDADGADQKLLPARRARELDLAAATLGVSDVVKLGYPDSGMTGTDAKDPGAAAEDSFSKRPLMDMVTRLVSLMQLYRPDVIVTYPPNGLSGHPDHIRTHDLVVAAHRNIVANSESEVTAGGTPPPPRLYYIALSSSRLREAQAGARAVFGGEAWVPPDEIAVDDKLITTVIDITPFVAEKLRALAAHASQPDARALLQIFSAANDSNGDSGHVEEYVRAYPPPDDTPFVVEADLFDSVGSPDGRWIG